MDRYKFYDSLNSYKKKDSLSHYGIAGQKWGTRRWQNADGTFNEAGKERYFGTKKSESGEPKKETSLPNKTSTIRNLTTAGLISSQLANQQHQQFVNQINQQNFQNQQTINQINQQHLQTHQQFVNQNQFQNHLMNTPGVFMGQPDKKEAKKQAKELSKEAEKLEKEFLTQSPYDKNYKYLDSNKIDEWLNKEENKAVEKAYADAMNTAFGDTSKELHELFKDYDNNEDEYVAKAAICDSLDYNNTLGDISSEVRWFMGDDGDQGSRNSHAYYLNEKGYTPKDINQKLAEAENALNEGYEVGKKLSQYYNPVIPHMSEKLQKELYNRINYRWEKTDDYSFNKILEASDGGDFNKDNMKTANTFAKKLAPSCDDKNGDGWWYFNQAVRNLDMEGLNYKDMTQSDWNDLNAEINKLKKK